MTVDEMVDRIEVLNSYISIGKEYRWDVKGLTLKHGNQNGHNGWNASVNCHAYYANGDTMEEALSSLLVLLEAALAKHIEQSEATVSRLRDLQKRRII
jgi:hypothetical protein